MSRPGSAKRIPFYLLIVQERNVILYNLHSRTQVKDAGCYPVPSQAYPYSSSRPSHELN